MSIINLASWVERVPVACFWEITDACNLRCVHCWSDSGRAAPDELTTEEALGVADSLAAAGCRRVYLTGGEPLERADWPAIADRLRQRAVAVTLITNGVRVNAATLATMREVGVIGLSVSVDGSREVHDSLRVGAPRGTGSVYDRALRAIEQGKRAGLRITAITQVHRRNLSELEAMGERFAELGVDVWQIQLCRPVARLARHSEPTLLEPRQLPELEATLGRLIDRQRVPITVGDNIGYYGRLEPKLRSSDRPVARVWTGCMAGCRVVALCANGDVKGCPSHPHEFAVGNVRETPFATLWADPARFPYNTAFDEDLLEGGCAECAYRRICRAGCTSMAYAVTGTIYDNPFCLQRADEEPGERRRDIVRSALAGRRTKTTPTGAER
jgi:radical SAM protein with 4Fe4S-binding SPASM domain